MWTMVTMSPFSYIASIVETLAQRARVAGTLEHTLTSITSCLAFPRLTYLDSSPLRSVLLNSVALISEDLALIPLDEFVSLSS